MLFLETQHWPSSVDSLGVGASFLEMLILVKRGRTEGLALILLLQNIRKIRHISVAVVPCGPGIEFRRRCAFLGNRLRTF